MEVWGGHRLAAQPIELPGVVGWVYSNPLGHTSEGGDVYYFSLCNQGLLTRIALADVAGHGSVVSTFASVLHSLIDKHINTLDQSGLMKELNEACLDQEMGIPYATTLVLSFYLKTGCAFVTNAGHPPALWYRAGFRRWELLEGRSSCSREIAGLPLGLISDTTYKPTSFELDVNDVLLLYTDGISEATDVSGRELGGVRLRELASRLDTASPLRAGQGLLAALEAFRGEAPLRDDETLIVLKRVGSAGN